MTEEIKLTRIGGGNAAAFSELLPEGYSYASPGRLCLGASLGGFAAGILVFSIDGRICNIDWLYVDEDKRRRGIAKTLIAMVKKIVKESSVRGISAFFDGAEENLRAFFEGIGFGVFPGAKSYTLSYQEIMAAPETKKVAALHGKEEIERLRDITPTEKNQLRVLLRKTVMSDVAYSKCSEEISYVAKKKGLISGCLLCSDISADEIMIELLYNYGDEEMISFTPAALLSRLLHDVGTDDRKQLRLRFIAANPKILDFVETITGYGRDDLTSDSTCYAVVAV